MKGKPKFLNTKQDYLNFLAMGDAEGVTDADKKQALKALRDSAIDWFAVADVDKDAGVVDDTHKVIVNDNGDGTTTYTQYELRENPDARLFSIGFTMDEINALIVRYN